MKKGCLCLVPNRLVKDSPCMFLLNTHFFALVVYFLRILALHSLRGSRLMLLTGCSVLPLLLLSKKLLRAFSLCKRLSLRWRLSLNLIMFIGGHMITSL